MPDSTPQCMKSRPVHYTLKLKVKAKLKQSDETAMLKPVSGLVSVIKKDETVRLVAKKLVISV